LHAAVHLYFRLRVNVKMGYLIPKEDIGKRGFISKRKEIEALAERSPAQSGLQSASAAKTREATPTVTAPLEI
jgi:hypothetical protein